jgi:hypothetical protein
MVGLPRKANEERGTSKASWVAEKETTKKIRAKG